MSDVFVSYAREDRDRVEPLVRLLESFGLTVWWDRELNAGDSFETAIDKAILASRCVVVVWSEHSIDSQWVRNEALEGMERHILVPVRIDDVRVPVAFKQLQAINFVGWPDSFEQSEYEDLASAVQQKLKDVELSIAPNPLGVPAKKRGNSLTVGGLLLLVSLVFVGYMVLQPDLNDPAGVIPEEAAEPHALTDNPIVYRKFLQAQDRLRRGEHEDVDAAIALLVEVTQAAPDFPDGYAALCLALLDSYVESNDGQEYQQAEKACNRALFLDQDNPDVYIALGELFAQAGEYSRGEEAFNKAIQLDGSASDAYLGLGFLYMKEGKVVQAESAFKQATALDPQYVKAQHALGRFYMQQGLFYQAAETYQVVTGLVPQNALAWNNLGVAKMMEGEFEQAFAAWENASDLNKSSAAYSNMGYVLYLQQRFAEAAAYIELAIKDNETDHRLWGNLADMLRFIPDRHSEMKSAYEKAIALAEENRLINPEDGYLLGRLAVYYAALGDKQMARELIELTRLQAQNDIYILFDIAVALSILGDKEAAEQQLIKATDAGYPAVLSDSDPQFQ